MPHASSGAPNAADQLPSGKEVPQPAAPAEAMGDWHLAACGLPLAWRGQPNWTLLATNFGAGLGFLRTWQAWRADSCRPRLLHVVALSAAAPCADALLRCATADADPALTPLVHDLAAQLWGLLPGFHRLALNDGQVLLTLCIGDMSAQWAEQTLQADTVFLHAPALLLPNTPPSWSIHALKAIARCCKIGARLSCPALGQAERLLLLQCGFMARQSQAEDTLCPAVAPPEGQQLGIQAVYQPRWTPKQPADQPRTEPARCVVVGSGLAGAAVAASLARRGWAVTVLDRASHPAAGASALPAGVLAAHVSADDSWLSRLSRHGVRTTWQQAQTRLRIGIDWQSNGVLEHQVERTRQCPAAWQHLASAADWATPASAEQLAAAHLPITAPALWHAKAGWIQPARLVDAWLASPGVRWQGQASVATVKRQAGVWQLQDAQGRTLAQAELVVLAAGPHSQHLAQQLEAAGHADAPAHAGEFAAPAPQPLALQPIRGQATWGWHDHAHTDSPVTDSPVTASPATASPATASLTTSPDGAPPFAVNGLGSLVARIPLLQRGVVRSAWVIGSSFQRDDCCTAPQAADDAFNFARLHKLLPATGPTMQARYADTGRYSAWAGVRCATPSRLPAVGPLRAPQAWVCSGMGSRGLSFSSLCAELLAAQLHGEPWPLERSLGQALKVARMATAANLPQQAANVPAADGHAQRESAEAVKPLVSTNSD